MIATITTIVLLQTLVLVFMVGKKQWTLHTGKLVTLETQPVDPRSLFRGDYVRLRYKRLSGIRPEQLHGPQDMKKYDSIFVTLKKIKGVWYPTALHRKHPEVRPNYLILKGKIKYISRPYNSSRGRSMLTYSVRYGIENYFVPEGTGMELERPKKGEKVSIQVAIDAQGNAGIKAVLINGKPRYIETLF